MILIIFVKNIEISFRICFFIIKNKWWNRIL